MKKWYHVAFLALCAAVVVVLALAPKMSTPRLPRDPDHANRKEYERCPSCHGLDSANPMPHSGNHNHFAQGGALRGDHHKCYFCHKPKDG